MKIFILLTIIKLTVLQFSLIWASDFPTQGPDSTQITITLDSENKLNITQKEKSILRYGFQKTKSCKDFDKAFMCVRKCLELGYQIAHSDKNCACSCKKNMMIAKYKQPPTGHTEWKLGAPTTSLPPWVKNKGVNNKETFYALDDYEVTDDPAGTYEENDETANHSKTADATDAQGSNEAEDTTGSNEAHDDTTLAANPGEDQTDINDAETDNPDSTNDPNQAETENPGNENNEEAATEPAAK